MRMFRAILSFILVTALLAGGFPVSIPEDADRDLDVDLQDAVQWASKIAETAETPQDFKQTFQRTVSALRMAAGMKTVIRSSEDSTSDNGTAFSSGLYLISSNAYIIPAGSCFISTQGPDGYRSCFLTPPSPPPEIC